MSESDIHPEDIWIELPSGLRLEANFWTPRESDANQENKLAVCLHPWSWLGGRKDDPALNLLVDPLIDERYHIIQYNARGVGGSAGWPSFTGFTEGKDLEQVVKWAMKKIPNVQSVLIAGYSHGSLIASLFPVLPSVKTSHLLLSYPLGPRSWLKLFSSSSYIEALNKLLRQPDSNVLVIFGDRDEFTSTSRYRDWVAGLTGNIQVVEVAEASHFWHGRAGQELANAVRRWLTVLLQRGVVLLLVLSSKSSSYKHHQELETNKRPMPLPDERPRQSVANLIGRFETQTKRLSLSAGTPSRSNSVVSHITGDSSKEEIKEKREWPPKSAADKEKDKAPPSSYRHIPPAVDTKSAPPKDVVTDEVPLTAKALSTSQMQAKVEPNAFLENWRKDLPEPTEMVSEPATAATASAAEKPADAQTTPIPASSSKFASSQPPRTPATKASAAKSTSKTTSATPARTAVKPATSSTKSPAPKPSLTPSTSQPLKPQHTGQSTASTTAGVRRNAAKTPTTPHPKTPARSDVGPRAKTPTSARPKTPSTGLFAPTAASLAKARNAVPAVPQAVKKATISSSSMERLSKPTTASMNRARGATAAPSATSKTPATPPRTTAASRAKSAVSPSPSRVKPMKKEGSVPNAAGGAAIAATVATAGLAAAVAEETNGHTEDVFTSDPETSASEPAVIVEDTEAPAHEEVEPEELHPEPEVADNDVTPRSPSPPSPIQAIAAEHQSEDIEQAEEPHIEGPAPPTPEKTDLEDIVNLLETVAVAKPTPSTDDLLEIPDVEEDN